jgi:peroxiredoxin
LPELEAVYQTNKDKGLLVIGVTTSGDAQAVQKVIDEKKITFPILFADDKIEDSFGGQGTPETFVINTEGVVVEHVKGPRGLDFFVARAEQLLTSNK